MFILFSENMSSVYCGNNYYKINGRRIGTRHECLKQGIGAGLHADLSDYDPRYSPIIPNDNYCGNDPVPPPGKILGTPSACLRKGVGVGKRMQYERVHGVQANPEFTDDISVPEAIPPEQHTDDISAPDEFVTAPSSLPPSAVVSEYSTTPTSSAVSEYSTTSDRGQDDELWYRLKNWLSKWWPLVIGIAVMVIGLVLKVQLVTAITLGLAIGGGSWIAMKLLQRF